MTSKRFYIHRLTVHFVLPFECGPLVTAVQMSLAAAMRDCSWRTIAEAVYAAAMKGCTVNTCVNKSLVLVQESCPSNDVTPSAVLPNLVPSLMEIQGQLA